MSLPKDAELLGANREELEIKGATADTIVAFPRGGRGRLVAALSPTATAAGSNRVYLVLENIRGTNDAAILSVYINLPLPGRPDEHPDLMAGAVGLYGLRRTSIPSRQNGGSGLTFTLDITSALQRLLADDLLDACGIRVSLVPHRPLDDSRDITVGRVCVITIPPH